MSVCLGYRKKRIGEYIRLPPTACQANYSYLVNYIALRAVTPTWYYIVLQLCGSWYPNSTTSTSCKYGTVQVLESIFPAQQVESGRKQVGVCDLLSIRIGVISRPFTVQ